MKESAGIGLSSMITEGYASERNKSLLGVGTSNLFLFSICQKVHFILR